MPSLAHPLGAVHGGLVNGGLGNTLLALFPLQGPAQVQPFRFPLAFQRSSMDERSASEP